MNTFVKTYIGLITIFALIWLGLLTFAYNQIEQYDDFFAEEMQIHSRHVATQAEELFKWFEEKQEVFVPAEANTISNPAQTLSITTLDGRVFSMPIPINLVKKLENQIQNGVDIRFVSNTPLNPQNKASSLANAALIAALESDSFEFFEWSEKREVFRYIRPLVATKSCLSCHVDATENQLIGAVIIDINPEEFILDAEQEANSSIIMAIIASIIVMIAFYVLALYMLRKYRHQVEEVQLSQQMTTNMSQEIELALGNMGHILDELKQGDFDNNRREHLLRSLQTINKDLLNTSFKIQAGGEQLRIQEEIFHVKDVFNNCMQMFHSQCAQKDLEFALHMDRSVPVYLLGHAYHLRQALVRLLKFSTAYTQKGRIDVRVKATTTLSSRFLVKDLTHLPIHLIVEIEDTGIGYVVTDKQHLLQNFAKMEFSGKKSNTRPVISLTPLNEIAALLDGGVSLIQNSKTGSCFKLVVQMKMIEEGVTSQSMDKTAHNLGKKESIPQDIPQPSDEKPQKQAARQRLASHVARQQTDNSARTLPELNKEISIILANSDYERAPQKTIDILKKEKINITHIRNGSEGFALLDRPNHGFSVVFLRKLADMDIIYAATRIRYVEKTRPDNPPVAIVLVADEILQTDMDALRFFNISSVDHVPRDPYAIIKLTKLALFTHKNRVFHGNTVFDETFAENNQEKYFDSFKALAGAKNDTQLLKSICSIWIRLYPTQMERINEISNNGDRDDQLRLIRAIKNSASTVCLPRLWAEANRLEKRLMDYQEIRYEKLQSIYEKTYEHMKEHKFS